MSDTAVFPQPTAASRAEVSETLRVPMAMLTRLIEIAPSLARRKFAKGGALYLQGERGSHIYVIVSGRVGITMLGAGGQELMIDILGAGALCGEGAAFDGLPRFSSASALEPSEALVVPVAEFCRLMSSDVELATLIAQAIALKQRMLASRLVQVAQASPEARITELLSQISFPDSAAIVLTHQQIANLIGASRITVTRAMQKLRREGAVRCKRGRYELVRPQHGALTN